MFLDAIKNGQSNIINLLLNDPRLNLDINEGLQTAAWVGNLNFVSQLLHHPNINTNALLDALSNAILRGNLNITNFLLADARVDPSTNNNKALNSAIFWNQSQIVDRLLQDPRVDPTINNNKALNLAIDSNRPEIVDRLLQDPRVDPSINNNKALNLAIDYNRFEIVDRLLQDPRVDPSINNNEAIRLASRYGRSQIVDRLLQDLRVNPTANNNEAIWKASEEIEGLPDRLDIVSRLLKDHRVWNSLTLKDRNFFMKKIGKQIPPALAHLSQ